jgi:hypothetical protein
MAKLTVIFENKKDFNFFDVRLIAKNLLIGRIRLKIG